MIAWLLPVAVGFYLIFQQGMLPAYAVIPVEMQQSLVPNRETVENPTMKRILIWLLIAAAPAHAVEDHLPDIVVYLADDLSAADLPVYGGANIPTPSIDALAAEGMTFNRAFVASPACAPSRAALLTGVMPARNGAEENHTFPREGTLRLPRVLNKLGYQTAAFGKVAHSKSAKDYGFDTIDLAKDIPELRAAVKTFLENRDDPRPLALFVGTSNPHVPWPSKSTVGPETMTLPPKLLDTPQTRVQRSRYLQDSILTLANFAN